MSTLNYPIQDDDDRDLVQLEQKLENGVDNDFFEDPEKFRTLNRVIDVLGVQCYTDIDSGTTTDLTKMHQNNPAYQALLKQRAIVENAIEQMAITRCAELNASVVDVGKVARQYNDAAQQVKLLRKQVADIRRSLGRRPRGGENAAEERGEGKSLRELWLKKLECEAVLGLLGKLEIIREAPGGFDALVMPRQGECRIVAAVVLLSEAINTMFSDDVAQVQAVTRIMDQLMTRKQKAEEIVWDTMNNILYLRTGNIISPSSDGTKRQVLAAPGASSSKKAQIEESNEERSVMTSYNAATQFNDSDESDDEMSVMSGTSTRTGATATDPTTTTTTTSTVKLGRMIPKDTLENDLDLQEDEIRCLEDNSPSTTSPPTRRILNRPKGELTPPRYTDATLALRLLIEGLVKLGRVDDVERYLNESVGMELRRIAETEQAATLKKLEKRKQRLSRAVVPPGGDVGGGMVGGVPAKDLKLPGEFKSHLRNLLSSFGDVMLRLSHLAQILRRRIGSDSTLVCPSYSIPSSALDSVLEAAYMFMQIELKTFLRACIEPMEMDGMMNRNQYNTAFEGKGGDAGHHTEGMFSLGIIDPQSRDGKTATGGGTGDAGGVVQLPADLFVSEVLFPKTNATPQVKYALSFRRDLERWTLECDELKKELAHVTGEDTSAPSYNQNNEETALKYLDNIIKTKLLPILQEQALGKTVSALERDDAFEPDMDSNLFTRSVTLQTTNMCNACQVLLDATTPLFNALHRVPKGGEMYTPLIQVVDYAIVTFITRAKHRITKIVEGKTAYQLIGTNEKAKAKLSGAVECRKAFQLLLQEYGESGDSDDLNLRSPLTEGGENGNGIMSPLDPSPNDTPANGGPSAGGMDEPLTEQSSEDIALEKEVTNLLPLLQFREHNYGRNLVCCTDDELMKAACLAHSLIKFARLLERRLKYRRGGWRRTTTRSLREAIANIRMRGLHMAKFCRIDMLVQTVKRMSQICKSAALTAQDTVRLPSCVNATGEYLATASDNLRDASGNAITAYALSSLEQYIPLLLMQSVRCIARREVQGTLTNCGIESLDRTGSVLYRDLKGATSFEGSFWDDAAAAESFERSASFIALLEMDMPELEKFYINNSEEFTESDYKLMFTINCPRRKGNLKRFEAAKAKVL